MKPRLLLIDNDPVQSKLKRICFSKIYDVVLVQGSKELSKYLNPTAEPFQVIVLDLMPIRERFIDLTAFVSYLKFNQIPPVFIVSHGDVVERYIRQITAYPMCEVVIKPLSLAFIEQRLNALVSEEKPPRYSIKPLSMDDSVAMHNMQIFMQHLSRCWLECIQANEPITLLYCNIDYFALMQSFHGKDHASYAIRTVQVMLQSIVQHKNDMAVRARRDDFYVVFTSCDEHGFYQKLKRLKIMLNEALINNHVSPLSPFLSISVGHVTQIPRSLEQLNIYVELAKARLNKAKVDRDTALVKSNNPSDANKNSLHPTGSAISNSNARVGKILAESRQI